jgi:hypothetical protein
VLVLSCKLIRRSVCEVLSRMVKSGFSLVDCTIEKRPRFNYGRCQCSLTVSFFLSDYVMYELC